jgi:hypothetical protein
LASISFRRPALTQTNGRFETMLADQMSDLALKVHERLLQSLAVRRLRDAER